MLSEIIQVKIGLEVHVQLKTSSKLFCGCSANFTTEPNSNICPVCLGHPGVLPVLNEKAVEYAIRLAIALHSEINTISVFSRKNYFYPDLPKGYQITQYEKPLCENGYVKIRHKDFSEKNIGLQRIHIEEDAAKSIHSDERGETMLDFNRSGIPLLEIVTKPELDSPEEAFLFLKKLHKILRYLNISTGNMEEGAMRCDANISLVCDVNQGNRTEIKNLNSFKFVYDGLESEISRQIKIHTEGDEVKHSTLKYSPKEKSVIPMRFKEQDFQYRYFDEPDLPPLYIDKNLIEKIKCNMPEMPDEKYQRYISEYSLSPDFADRLTTEPGISEFYEKIITEMNIVNQKDFTLAASWMLSEVQAILNENKININDFPINEKNIADLLKYISDGRINLNTAKIIQEEMFETGKSAFEIINEKDLLQITSDSEIFPIVRNVIARYPDKFNELKSGKEKLKGFFVGLILRESKGKANPEKVNKIIDKLLN